MQVDAAAYPLAAARREKLDPLHDVELAEDELEYHGGGGVKGDWASQQADLQLSVKELAGLRRQDAFLRDKVLVGSRNSYLNFP